MRLSILLLLVLFSVRGLATNYYVSLSGNTTNTGRDTSHTWSLAKMNSYMASFVSGDSILFKRGETFVGKIAVSKSSLKFGAYGSGRKPILTTLTQVTQWTQISTGIYESSVQALSAELNLVLINDSAMEKGRFPNTGYAMIDLVRSNQVVVSEMTTNFSGGDMVIRLNRFETFRYPITSQSSTTLNYTGRSPIDGMGIFVNNHPSTLDRFGEWYYDNVGKKLRVFFGTNSPSNYKVEIPSLSGDIFTINSGVSNVSVTGIDIKGSNGDGIKATSGSNNTVTNSVIRMVGIDAVEAVKQTNLTITNDSILYAHRNGASINIYSQVGYDYNDANYWGTQFSNNYINKTYFLPGMSEGGLTHGWAVRIDANHSTVSGNRIFNSGYQGIGVLADYSLISNNYINGFCSVKDDGAGIYTWGPKNSSTWSSSTAVAPTPTESRLITDNIVENGIGTGGSGAPSGQSSTELANSGIYCDDQSNHVWILRNSVSSAGKGIYLHNNSNINVHDNTVYNCFEEQLYLNHQISLGWNIRNIDVSRNIFFGVGTGQYMIKARSNDTQTDINSMGKIDSNYYSRPINELSSSTMFYWRDGGTTEHKLSLSGWKSAFSYDDASKLTYGTGTTVTSTTAFRYERNPTGNNVTIPLGNNVYRDPTGTTYNNGSLALGPWSSKVLILTGTGTVVNTKPVVTLNSPLNGSSAPVNTAINLTATATDADGASTITKVIFYRGTTPIDSAITGIDNSGSVYSRTWTPSTTGSYSISARVFDAAGGIDTSNIAVITVTTATQQDPTIFISSPVDASHYLTSDSIPFAATADDADGTVNKVEFLVNGSVFKTLTGAPFSFKWKFPTAGVYTITARATDNDLRTKLSDAITVSVDAASSTISVIITDPANNASFTAPATITINATATIQ